MPNIKLAFRLLRRTPFVSFVAISSLALGIGANAAIFSLVNQMLLRALPVQAPEHLVNFGAPGPKPGSQSCGQAGGCNDVFSYAMFRDLQREQTSFTAIAAHVSFDANIAARGRTLNAEGMFVSGSYFPVLGVQPALGRMLDANDDLQIGQSPVGVLSYDFWQNNFGSDPSILNQSMLLNGQTITIVGVAPRAFYSTTVGLRPAVFVPLTMSDAVRHRTNTFGRRDYYWIYLFGRLKPGVSVEQARIAVNVPYHAIINNVEAPLQKGMDPATLTQFRAKKMLVIDGERGQSSVIAEAQKPLTLLMAVTVFVLLIACANIANLLLVRGASRSGEMAVRLAIGGSRMQLIMQLLTEAMLLGVIGGILSLGVARVTLGAMASLLPAEAGSMFDIKLDGTVIAFTAAMSIATALIFGLFPALFTTRSDLIASLRASTGQPSGGRSASRWRSGLAIAQVALSMALLGTAGLFAGSLAKISQVDLGVKIDHVATFGVDPDLNGYSHQKSLQTLQRIEEALHQIPGATAVSVARVPLLGGSSWGTQVSVEGFPNGPGVDNDARFNEIGAGYFSLFGVPMMVGREFTKADALNAPRVAIVNQTFAKKFHLGTNPVGRHMGDQDKALDIVIVGLVRDAKYNSVKDEIPPLFFTPIAQDSTVSAGSFYVRTSQPPEQVLRSIPKLVASVDPNLPIEDLRTMPDQVKNNIFLDRFIGIFAATFAGLATILAAIGLYGVLAYTVAQRTREFGVRMALGAAPREMRWMVLAQVARMTLIGAVIGVFAAVLMGHAARSMLFNLQSTDPVVLAASVLVLAVVSGVAGLIPAIRASNVEPVKALRYD